MKTFNMNKTLLAITFGALSSQAFAAGNLMEWSCKSSDNVIEYHYSYVKHYGGGYSLKEILFSDSSKNISNLNLAILDKGRNDGEAYNIDGKSKDTLFYGTLTDLAFVLDLRSLSGTLIETHNLQCTLVKVTSGNGFTKN